MEKMLRELRERAMKNIEEAVAVRDRMVANFEKAASLRDEEKNLLGERLRLEKKWKAGEVGATGTSSARLGFEVRRDGKPIDPLGFLAGG